MKIASTLLIFLAVFGCSSESRIDKPDDVRVLAEGDSTLDATVILIPDAILDAEVIGACTTVQNIDPEYCFCHASCCQIQTWYCPPTGTEIQAKTAVLDICDDDLVPCDRNLDSDCPPAEIIDVTPCEHAFDCPPGINEDFTMYYDCEANGHPGRQEVRCDKGRLYYGECITCIPSDEICDGIDNDCDDETDEHQLNECGECGSLQPDTCDNIDNDCDGNVDEDLVRECVTECERGIEACVEGRWIGCTARQPTEETCDGFDNDCDALVDESLNCQCPPAMIGSLIPCMEPPLTCGMGFKTCECDNDDCSLTKMTDCLALCAWLPEELVPEDAPDTCDEFLGIAVDPEVCNNFDEDCDGLIDEQLTKSCYSGPEGTPNVGVCQLGEMLCKEGQWYGEVSSGDLLLDFCAGEVVPSREICDGADNDCDGITDFGEEIPDTDILFILDWSGSMTYSIGATRMAMNRFAAQFAAEDKLKWGLETGPRMLPALGQDDIDTAEYLRIETNITSFSDFMAAFANAGDFDAASSNEMLRDAIYLSIDNLTTNGPYDVSSARWLNRLSTNVNSIPRLEQFKINWRRDVDRIIIVFTDEDDQSYLVPEIEPSDLITAISATPDTKLYVFTKPYYRPQWRRYIDPTGGSAFILTSNSEQMYNDLMSILDEICLPSEQTTMCLPKGDPPHQFIPASFSTPNDYDSNR